MEILPATTVTVLTTQLSDIVTANALVIVGALGLGLAVAFTMRWFRKSTAKIK